MEGVTNGMTEEEKANIYVVGVRCTWRKKRGNSYINMYRGSETNPETIVTRSENVKAMNANPMLISQLMTAFGATGKAVEDFHVLSEYSREQIGKSSYYLKLKD